MFNKSTFSVRASAWMLVLTPAIVSAQGVPTTPINPPNPGSGVGPARVKSPDEVLPAVPATATDPAPPGSRSVRVDRMPTPGYAAPDRRGPWATSMSVEGMVTAIGKTGNDFQNETLRITVDPKRGWESYVAGPSARAAEAPSALAGGPESLPINLVLTGRTYTFSHTRTLDGIDLVGASMETDPAEIRVRDPVVGSSRVVPRAIDHRTSWRNIKVGSYVSIRYRKVGNLNMATNVSLIELSAGRDVSDLPPGSIREGDVILPPPPAERPLLERKTPVSPGALPRS